jgi:hypothetical protein
MDRPKPLDSGHDGTIENGAHIELGASEGLCFALHPQAPHSISAHCQQHIPATYVETSSANEKSRQHSGTRHTHVTHL